MPLSTGSFKFKINRRGFAPGGYRFAVHRGSVAPENEIFAVDDDGRTTVHGAVERDGPVRIESASAGNLVEFQAGGVTIGAITAGGLADFHWGGVAIEPADYQVYPPNPEVGRVIILGGVTALIVAAWTGTTWKHWRLQP